MPAPADAAPADAELLRLLDALIDAAHTQGRITGHPSATVQHRAIDRKEAARAALLAYLDRAYLCLPPPLDGEPVELERAEGDAEGRRRC